MITTYTKNTTYFITQHHIFKPLRCFKCYIIFYKITQNNSSPKCTLMQTFLQRKCLNFTVNNATHSNNFIIINNDNNNNIGVWNMTCTSFHAPNSTILKPSDNKMHCSCSQRPIWGKTKQIRGIPCGFVQQTAARLLYMSVSFCSFFLSIISFALHYGAVYSQWGSASHRNVCVVDYICVLQICVCFIASRAQGTIHSLPLSPTTESCWPEVRSITSTVWSSVHSKLSTWKTSEGNMKFLVDYGQTLSRMNFRSDLFNISTV